MLSATHVLSSYRDPYSVHVVIREHITVEMVRDGGLNNLELKGDMNLQISDPDLSKLKIVLAPAAVNFGPELQFKQHPKVDKFVANRDRVVALKDPSKGFPVGPPLAVLKWRYEGKDETYAPLSSECSASGGVNGIADALHQSTAGRHRLMMVHARSASSTS